MTSPSRLTVVISTYNHLRPLELCLAGFRNQTVPPGEILIADDGSGPDTRALIARLLPTLPCPARHIWHEDKGFRKNIILNRCLAEAKGDYLVLTGTDIGILAEPPALKLLVPTIDLEQVLFPHGHVATDDAALAGVAFEDGEREAKSLGGAAHFP